MAKNVAKTANNEFVLAALFDQKESMDLNTDAVKKMQIGEHALREAAKRGLWNLIAHGRGEVLTDLYRKLMAAKIVWAANAIKTHYITTVIDMYGIGGVTDDGNSFLYNANQEMVGGSKWEKRPPAFVTFRQKIKDDDKGHFVAVRTKDKDGNLPKSLIKQEGEVATEAELKRGAEIVANMKASKARIGRLGPDCLDIPWLAKAKGASKPKFGRKEAVSTVSKMLIKLAKNAWQNGFTKDQISAMARAGGLENISDIVGAYRADKPTKEETAEIVNSDGTESVADLIKSGYDFNTGFDLPRAEKPATDLHMN